MDAQEIAGKAAALMPELLDDLEHARRDPVDRVPRLPGRAGASGWAERDAATVPGGRLHQRPAHGGARPATRRSTARSPGRRGLTRRHALRALRRAAGAARAGLDERPVDADPQGRRPDLRARRRRRQGRARGPPRHDAGLRRQAAVHRQADPRGHGGDREQPRGVRRGPPRAVRRATCSSSATWATCGSASPSSRPRCAATSPASSPSARSSTRCTPGCSAAPAPDAMMALARLLATLHDDDGRRRRRRVSRRLVGRRRLQRGGPPRQRRPAGRRRS